MPIRSFKDKITSLASGEILGETLTDKEEKAKKPSPQPEIKKEISKKDPKVKSEKIPKEPNPQSPPVRKSSPQKIKEEKAPKEGGFFKRRKKEDLEEVVVQEERRVQETSRKSISTEKDNKMIREAIAGYEDVLELLNIVEEVRLDVEFTSKDMDYIEFTPTTPLGFDFDEVTDFISRVKYILSKYESALKQRNKDLIIVASEVKKVEQKMVEQNQSKELERMIGGMTEEEKLIEENMDLRVEVNNLKMQLLNNGNASAIKRLENEIEILRAENRMLISKEINSSESQSSDNFSLPKSGVTSVEAHGNGSLPSLPNDMSMPNLSDDNLSYDIKETRSPNSMDSIDEMIKNMGGFEEDE